MAVEYVHVKAIRYPEGHKLYPVHEAQPGGPLVPLMRGGREFIGWRRELTDKPVKMGEIVVEKAEAEIVDPENNTRRFVTRPVRYVWLYDPTPVRVQKHSKNDHILRAIRSGDLEEVDGPDAPKTKKKRKTKKKAHETGTEGDD